MQGNIRLVLIRMLPITFIIAAALFYAKSVEPTNIYLWRNFLPMLTVILLAFITLVRGGGRWTGNGWRWPLGIAGFFVPAVGLSMYLHYGYSVDMDGMVSGSIYPQELFRFLPWYTGGSGMIGFAIGWIAGKNIR